MKIRTFALILALFPCVSMAAERSTAARVSVGRGGAQAAARMPTMVANAGSINASKNISKPSVKVESGDKGDSGDSGNNNDSSSETSPAPSANCRDAYRECMDQFCLLDESEGYRCACSDNVHASDSILAEIQKIQDDASKLYTEGVEMEKLGAQAKLVFTDKKDDDADSDEEDTDGLGEDAALGDALFTMASGYCAAELEACGGRAEMEETLYKRQVTADCKTYASYLDDQKRMAEENLAIAEAAVREARLSMLETTNKYNRIECFNVLKACVQDTGGCGMNFENCLDSGVLARRAEACEGVYDNCMAVKEEVQQDWKNEMDVIFADAQKFATNYRRQNCISRMKMCLEDNCAVSSNASCLTNQDAAFEVCKIESVCDLDSSETGDDYSILTSAVKIAMGDVLTDLRHGFCESDLGACLRKACGEDFAAPECVGKGSYELATKVCPQNMFSTCDGLSGGIYEGYITAAANKMDYKSLTGCIDRVSQVLGEACGTDMSCLPTDDLIVGLTEVPGDDFTYTVEGEAASLSGVRKSKAKAGAKLKGQEAASAQVRANARKATDAFFATLEKDPRIVMCIGNHEGDDSSILGAAKYAAQAKAEERAQRELELKIAELSRKLEVEDARKICLDTYKVEEAKEYGENETYSRISSVSFEPSLRNCHVCRVQRVCETGGKSKGEAALEAAAGGLTGGAAMGTMVNAGWGTAIGGAIGAVGAGLVGMGAGGKETYCQEIESCEDINM